MSTSNHTQIFEDVIKVQSIRDLIRPNAHKCEACGQVVEGDIPFKMHKEKCMIAIKAKEKVERKKKAAKPVASPQLKSILKAKFSE